MEKASHNDIAALIEIRAAVRENILRDLAKVPDTAYHWFIDHSTIWIWRENDRILGFAAADPRDGTIWALFLRPEAQGRGIGTALLNQTLDDLRTQGWRQATLWTDADSRAARFYQTWGWRHISARQGEVLLQIDL